MRPAVDVRTLCIPSEPRVATGLKEGVMDRELYSINQARMLMGGISRGTLYGLLRSGVLISVPIGRRRFITAEAIKSFIASAAEKDAQGCRLIALGAFRGPV